MPFYSAEGPALSAFAAEDQPTTPLPWLNSGARFTCAAFASILCVISPAGAALLVLWALAFTGKVSLTTGYISECAYALAVRVAAYLAARALKETVGCNVHLDGYREPDRLV
jgi:hypothetical protein